jgi:hypothetical protein
MGYRSDYDLDLEGITREQQKEIRAQIERISEYRFTFEHGLLSLTDAKWYTHRADMQHLSELFPDAKFSLCVTGEDGHQWIVDAYQGQTDQRDGTMVFPKRTLW